MPSYMGSAACRGRGGRRRPQRAERLAGQGVGLRLGVAVGRDDHVAEVGEVVGVAAVEAAGLDLDADQLADAVDGHGDRAAGDGAVDGGLGAAPPGRPAAAPASAGPAGAARSCRSRRHPAEGVERVLGHGRHSCVAGSLVVGSPRSPGRRARARAARRCRARWCRRRGRRDGRRRRPRPGRPRRACPEGRVWAMAPRAAAIASGSADRARRRGGSAAGPRVPARARPPRRRPPSRWRGAGSPGGVEGPGGRRRRRRGAGGGGAWSGRAPGSTMASTCQSTPTTSIAAWRRISSQPPLTKESRAPALVKPRVSVLPSTPDHLGVLGEVHPGHPAAQLGRLDDVGPEAAYVDQRQPARRRRRRARRGGCRQPSRARRGGRARARGRLRLGRRLGVGGRVGGRSGSAVDGRLPAGRRGRGRPGGVGRRARPRPPARRGARRAASGGVGGDRRCAGGAAG